MLAMISNTILPEAYEMLHGGRYASVCRLGAELSSGRAYEYYSPPLPTSGSLSGLCCLLGFLTLLAIKIATEGGMQDH